MEGEFHTYLPMYHNHVLIMIVISDMLVIWPFTVCDFLNNFSVFQ